jgi:hypothetical protein
MNKSLLTIAALFVATSPMLRTHKARSEEPKRVRPQAKERPGPLGRSSVERLVPRLVPSGASWASRNGRGFENMS